MLSAAADFAQSVSIVLASLFVIYGLDEWRREFVWKRRVDLAEEALALFYQARDAISAIRSPSGYVGEGRSRQPGPDEAPEDKEALDHAYSLIERYQQHSELFAKIGALRYRFMAQHGEAAAAPFNEMIQIVNELILSARRMSRLVTRRARRIAESDPVRFEQFGKEQQEVVATFYEGFENDPIALRVQRAVAALELMCRGVMESRGTLFSLINWRVGSRQKSQGVR